MKTSTLRSVPQGDVRVIEVQGEGANDLLTPTEIHGREYRERGLVADSFALADPTAVSRLLEDAPSFATAVAANRVTGRHAIPYAVTDAIREVAHDRNIVSLIEAILGADQRWVMWGSNIQAGTPNAAGSWHVDLESFRWPTITVAVGLEGCTADNSTNCIPYSNGLGRAPAILSDRTDTAEALATASGFDPRCTEVVAPHGFSDGRFYAFDARCWHSGETTTSADRVMLFLHYQAAIDPRIPLMTDYSKGTWAREPVPYLVGPSRNVSQEAVNTDLYPVQRSVQRRMKRVARRTLDRVEAIARWVRATADMSRP